MKSKKTTKNSVSEYFSKLAKRGHKKNPRPRSFYVKIAKIGVKKMREKLSTGR